MAQHNVTGIVEELLAAGHTIDQIKARADIRDDYNGGWFVWNRTEESKLTSIGDAVEWAREAAADRAAQARADSMITDRQVDYIISLLVQRIRSGEDDGFMSTHNLWNDDHTKISKPKIQALTKSQASNIISSLKGTY